MATAGGGGGGGGVAMFRGEYWGGLWREEGGYMEKRQVFLRSYHFSRKKSGMERLRLSGVRVRRLIWLRLCTARRLPRLLWHSLRCAWFGTRRRFSFHRLFFHHHHHRSSYYVPIARPPTLQIHN